MEANQSKILGKGDDSAKIFIKKSLGKYDTHGFDHDSIYYVQGKYYLFEYLKCDNSHMTPHTSHPRYYPNNWRKFYSLWQTSKRLGAYLLLVNYSLRPEDENLVKVMYVKNFDYQKLDKYLDSNEKKCDYLIMDEYKLSFDEFSKYLIALNTLASLPKAENEELPSHIMRYIRTLERPDIKKRHPLLPKEEQYKK